MEKQYKVVFVYPDGHIEEIDDVFNNGRDALEYGNNLLGRVNSTEKNYHHDVDPDNFFQREISDPYFMIVELGNKKYRLVYDSRSR